MNCVSPPELTDPQLLAYLDGEADPEVATHWGRCAYCRKRGRQLAHLQNRLAARLHRLTCPSPTELGEYNLSLLAPAQAAAVAQHLRECPHCVQEVAQLKDYLSELTPAAEPGLLSQVKVLVARLVGEPREDRPSGQLAFAPALAGIRGGRDEPYIYRAENVQIVIEVQDDAEQPDRKVLLGLVTGLGVQGCAVHLQPAELPAITVTVDEAGNFRLPHLPSGRYELILEGSGIEIRVPALEV